MWAAMRVTSAELRDLHTQQERLDAEARNLGMPAPPRKEGLSWGPGLLERTPIQVWRAVTDLGGWVAGEQVADALSAYIRDRVFVARRDNPNEPAPSWDEVAGRWCQCRGQAD
jgi:hypothetical protein